MDSLTLQNIKELSEVADKIRTIRMILIGIQQNCQDLEMEIRLLCEYRLKGKKTGQESE